jgi:hypothetical protein
MSGIFKDLFTGRDGQTFDLGRVLWAMSVLVLILAGLFQTAFLGAALFGHVPGVDLWTPEGWGIWGAGVGAQLPMGAGALALKARTEPAPGERVNA